MVSPEHGPLIYPGLTGDGPCEVGLLKNCHYLETKSVGRELGSTGRSHSDRVQKGCSNMCLAKEDSGNKLGLGS